MFLELVILLLKQKSRVAEEKEFEKRVGEVKSCAGKTDHSGGYSRAHKARKELIGESWN